MADNRQSFPAVRPILAFLVTLIFLQERRAFGQVPDAQCLMAFKNSVSDPENRLVSWQEADASRVCHWKGVQCFKIDSVPVYKLSVFNFGLSSSWPAGLHQCHFLQTVDLSYNAFTGPIPSTICDDIPNLVELNVEHNRLRGSIPGTLATCKYLNSLFLNNNHLEGEIPAEIALAPRLSQFDVSNNQLSGVIPSAFAFNVSNGTGFNASCFVGNPYLCGAPLTGDCKSKPGKKQALIIGGIFGGVFALLLLIGILFWRHTRWSRSATPVLPLKILKPRGFGHPDAHWLLKIREPGAVTVSMFENPIDRVKFTDLMAATNDFSHSNIISTSATGTMYSGTFVDGTPLVIKRLHVSSHNDKAFKSEMETLGHLKHRNVAPLLGFCVAAGERLLVYEHMGHGNLWGRLHPASGESSLEWTERVRVATGCARGLAWLHHNRNPRILHRNINSKAILLDHENEPKITDFGLARHMDPMDTHVSTFFNGDYGNVGYVAPEFTKTLNATTKGDVYSFGVVLLELVTGQEPVHVVAASGGRFAGNLVEYVKTLSSSGTVVEAVDASVQGDGLEDEILQILKVAISCVGAEAKERPTMFEVYQLLRAIGQKYNYTTPFDDLPTMGCTDEDDVVR